MVFPSDSVYHERSLILDRVHAGEITDLQGAHEALQADPKDANALYCIASHAEESGDLEEAERYARAVVRIHPNGPDGYVLLGRILSREKPDSLLGKGYSRLGELTDRFEPDGVDLLYQDIADEPPEVERELRPHRLLFELRERSPDVLERRLVDEILEHAEACQPLLLGILKEYGEEQITDDDFTVVERALALLGEIGSPEVLPAITEFLTLKDEDLAGPADWAFRRISFRRPAETITAIREMLPTAETPDLIVLAEQLSLMPDVPGRPEAIAELTSDIQQLTETDREAVIFAAITAYYLTEGAKSPRAAALERQYEGSFSKEGRADLRKIHQEIRGLEAHETTPDELSIYDICCTEPPEEDHEHEPVRVAPKPGRNEPCWCGSGKKYKKCHLDEDQSR